MAQSAVFDAQAVTAAVNEGIGKIEKASSSEELKAIKTQYAGAESAMTQASKAIGSLPADQKKEAGKLMGKLRADFGRAYGPKEVELKEAAEKEGKPKAELAASVPKITLPALPEPLVRRLFDRLGLEFPDNAPGQVGARLLATLSEPGRPS